MSDRLDELTSDVRELELERDWAQFHYPKNLAMLISSEAGELLAEYRWISTDDADAYTDDPEARARVEGEVAGVVIALLTTCVRLNIDLPIVVRDKLSAVRRCSPASSCAVLCTALATPTRGLRCQDLIVAHQRAACRDVTRRAVEIGR